MCVWVWLVIVVVNVFRLGALGKWMRNNQSLGHCAIGHWEYSKTNYKVKFETRKNKRILFFVFVLVDECEMLSIGSIWAGIGWWLVWVMHHTYTTFHFINSISMVVDANRSTSSTIQNVVMLSHIWPDTQLCGGQKRVDMDEWKEREKRENSYMGIDVEHDTFTTVSFR